MDKTPRWNWYELMTTDPAAAQRFYLPLVGWKAETWPDPAMAYTVINSASGGLGGISNLPESAQKMGAPPHWLGVVGVPDADATAARCKELGGAVFAEPFDIPNVGRYAVLADPTGAVFAVLAATMPAPADYKEPDRDELGRVAWHELWTSDPAAAWAFYSQMFGWVEKDTMDMGPMGAYRMFALPGDERATGGIAGKMPDQPVSAWCFYFHVPSADEAVNQIKELGGKVIAGPNDVPGGGRMLMAFDPQGAAFALYSVEAKA